MNALWYVEMCIMCIYVQFLEEAFAYHYIYYSIYTSIMFN